MDVHFCPCITGFGLAEICFNILHKLNRKLYFLFAGAFGVLNRHRETICAAKQRCELPGAIQHPASGKQPDQVILEALSAKGPYYKSHGRMSKHKGVCVCVCAILVMKDMLE